MPIKNIIFDVGNVCIIWDPYPLFEPYFKNKADIDAFIQETSFIEMDIDTDRGVPVKEAVENTIKKFPHHKKPLLAYDYDWLKGLTGAVEGTEDLMKDLKSKGYKLYGLSNFAREKFDLCTQRHSFAEHFDGLVVSSDVKEIKPGEKIYKILLSNYSLKPEECVFLDDRQENLDTAEKLDFKTVLFTNIKYVKEKMREMGVKIS